jgi:hypothetical protein
LTPTTDELLDRLVVALDAAGARPPDPAPSEAAAALAAIDAAISPQRLPDSVRRFWERFDTEDFPLQLGPHFTGATSALEIWDSHLGDHMTPPVVFPLSYESHDFYWVELEGPDGEAGGSIWRWAYGGDRFELYFESFDHLLRTGLTALADGRFKNPYGRIFVVDDPGAEHFPYTGPEDRPVHPAYGLSELLDLTETWPDRWIASIGWDPDERWARGADHALADALPALQAGRGARVNATVASAQWVGDGQRVVLEADGAQLAVFVPRMPFPDRGIAGGTFEFDLVAPGTLGSEVITVVDTARVEQIAVRNPAAAEALRPWTLPPEAVATAVRVLPPR